MNRKQVGWCTAIAWGLLLTLWPKASDIWHPPSAHQGTTGEGLYKTNQTKANFGLVGVRFFESNNGKKRWNIESDWAELHRKENYAYLEVVHTKFFAEKTGNIVYTVSDRGRAWTDKSLVELEGNVSITSQKGYRFTMEKLNYDGNSHEFSSGEFVQMTGPDIKNPVMFLEGIGLLADIDREHFTVKKEVKARKAMKDGKWLRITSKIGEFFTDESRAVFIGNVHSILPDAVIDSDIFEMTMGHETDDLHARGRVTLKSKDRVGKAENAYLAAGGNEIILEGKARVDSKDNHIQGRKIRLFSDDERILVEDAEGKMNR